MYICTCAQGAHGDQKKWALELGLQVVVSFTIELWSSEREAIVLTCCSTMFEVFKKPRD